MRLSERIYRVLIEAYPAAYLRRYREPMIQLFSDQVRGASGPGPLFRLWLRTLADLLRTVPQQYFGRRRRLGMFNTYSQPARRSIFFARYRSACLGHDSITAEDLLAGLLREDREIRNFLRTEALEEIHRAIGITAKPARRISLSQNTPLSESAKQILSLAAREAESSGAKQIAPCHLLASIVTHGNTMAADLLRRYMRS
jgi:Clp amino terminal domain, pathogenicity island component